MNQPATAEQAARAHFAKYSAAIPCIPLFLPLSSCLPAQTTLWNQVSTTYTPKNAAGDLDAKAKLNLSAPSCALRPKETSGPVEMIRIQTEIG